MSSTRYLKFLCCAGVAIGCVDAFALTDARWTNGIGTGLWNTAGNWSGTVVPDGIGYRVLFNDSAEVTLDTGVDTAFGALEVASGKSVTISSTTGSSLKPCGAVVGNGSGFVVNAGATLTIHAPVSSDVRVDKWGLGTLETDSDWTCTASSYPFIFGAGTNVFYGSAVVSTPNGSLSFANGNGGVYSPLFLRDRAKLVAKSLDMAVGGDPAEVEVLQEGPETEVRVENNLVLNSAGNLRTQRWTQKAGTFESGGVIVGNKYGNGRGRLSIEGGSFATTNLTVRYGEFNMQGGDAVVRNILNMDGSTGTVNVVGGTLTVGGSLNISNTTMTIAGGEVTAPNLKLMGGAYLNLEGGRLTVPPATDGTGLFFTTTRFRMHGGEFAVNDAYTLMVNQTVDGGRLIVGGVAGKTVKIASGRELACMENRYRPFGVTVKSGCAFSLQTIASRVTAPLDLEIEAGGKIDMSNGASGIYNRGLLVAHRVVVDGVEQAKGRYAGGSASWFSGNAAATVVVPYVWTGAAGDGRWANAGNWEGNAVPPSNTTSACIDLSRACDQTITLDSDVSASCIIMNGVSGRRTVTLTGGHTLTLGVPNDYGCSLYVGPGREIVLDVNVARAGAVHMSFLGSGRVVVKKGFINSSDSHSPHVSLDATLVFAGTTALANGLSLWTHENEGLGTVRFEEGAQFSTGHLCAGRNGFYGIHEFIQDGGAVTTSGGIYMTYGNATVRPPERYALHAGTMTLGTGIFLGNHLSSSWADRRPGGDFFMDGGTVTTPKLAMEGNGNRYYLYGGTVNLGAGGFAREHNGANLKTYAPNEDHVYLGAVTIRSTAASTSTLNWILDGNAETTVLDTTRGAVTQNGNVSGTGILRKLGGTALTLNGTNTMTGSIVVEAGTLTYGTTSKLSGAVALSVADGASLYLLGETGPEVMVSAARAEDVYLPANASVTVAKFVVNGVAQPVGSYPVGSGTIVVAPPGDDRFVWTGASGGDWTATANWTEHGVPQTTADEVDFLDSPLASTHRIDLDADVSLKKLVYSHPTDGATLTIGAGGAMTFPNGGEITVAAGCTLVFDCDVHAAGYLYKYGMGRVVFNGKLRSAVEPAALTSDVSFYRTREGVSEIRGEVAGLRLWTDAQGTAQCPPKCVICDGAVVTNRVSINMAWISSELPGVAETVQDGGRVDMTSPTPNFSWDWAFCLTKGGTFKYVLNDGFFSMPTHNSENRVSWGGDAHVFTFEQNGGTSVFHKFVMGDLSGHDDRILLNDGTLRILGGFAAKGGQGKARIDLNGGTLALNSGRVNLFPGSYQLVLGGDVTLDQGVASASAIVMAPMEGAGTVTQRGPALFDFREKTYIDGTFAVESGRLALSAPTTATNFVARGGSLEFVNVTSDGVPACSTVSIDDGAVLRLANTGEIVVKSLKLGGQSRAAGVYGANQPRFASFFTGDGTLRVLEGHEPGTLFIVR